METSGVRTVTEIASERGPGRVHPGWISDLPWLMQGVTGRTHRGEPFDLGLFAEASDARRVQENWQRLRSDTGFVRAVHARQPHQAAVRVHGAGVAGLLVADPCDGHATADPGVLLTVTVADCVPVFVVDVGRRAVALLHAGWRGAAGGVLERGVAVLGERMDSRPSDLRVHLGPSICGACYEVGPEVFGALGLKEPGGPTPLDLRRALATRAVAAGVPAAAVTCSTLCTLCGPDVFFSHRGGDAGRQVAYLGVSA